MNKTLTLILLTAIIFNGKAQKEYIFAEDFDSPVASANFANPALVDIDNDGDLDLFVGQHSSNKMLFYRNIGTADSASFEQQLDDDNPLDKYTNNSGCNSPSFIDIDNDGDLDAMVGTWSNILHYYKNEGSATVPDFKRQTVANNPLGFVSTPGNCNHPAFVDIDGDSDQDVFISDRSGNIDLFINKGTATVPEYEKDSLNNPLGSLGLSGATKLVFEDLTGDGIMDVLIGSFNNETPQLLLYKNTGTVQAASFELQTDIDTPIGNAVVFDGAVVTPALGDLDADGDLDMMLGVNKTVFLHRLENRVVSFNDVNFKNAILNHSPVIDINDDGKIQYDEARNYTGRINAENKEIIDLTGIEAFNNVQILFVFDNSITQLDLSNNTKLKVVQAYNNELTALDITKSPELINLNVSNNLNLDSLNVTQNPLLTSLKFDKANVSSIDLTNNVALIELFADDNKLKVLDLNELVDLTKLSIKNNELSALDLSTNSALTKIEVNGNKLTSLNIKNGNNSKITTFLASGNELECIQVDDSTYSSTNWTIVDAKTSFSENCSALVGLSDAVMSDLFKIYPNPTNGNTYINGELKSEWKLLDVLGNIVLFGKDKEIETDRLTDGVYFLQLNDLSYKLIKQ